MRKNPYLNRLPVRDPARFYGRKREVRRVMAGLAADPPQSFSLVGDRRIGKSSLLHQLQNPDVLRTNVPETVVGSLRLRYHDFQSGAPSDEPAFLEFLCRHVAAALGAPAAPAPSRECLLDLLRQLDAAGLRLALLWDEFEVVTRHRGLGLETYAFLRSLAQNHRLAFITASGRDLRTVCHSAQVADSPFFNVFQTLRLRPLSREEARLLATEPSEAAGLPLGAYADRLIDDLAGTFPFFLQIAGAALFEHLDETGAGAPDFAAVEDRFLEESEPHFRYVWEERLSEEERRVMAEAARGRVTTATSRRVAERLEREGYVAKRDGGYAPFSRCFARFVRESLDEATTAEEEGATVMGETRADTSRLHGAPPAAGVAGPASRRISTPGPLGPGSVLLGKYEVVSELGEGGMGKVYLARHIDLGRKIVVKVLNPQVAKAPDMITRFRREAMAASAIGHPNVVQVHDFDWHEDGRPFLVMEYLEGEDLAQRIYGRAGNESHPLAPREALEIACAACEGLGAAHDRHVVHRDLKPSNLFLARPTGTTPSGPRGYVVKLLDFGISKIVDVGAAQPLTRSSGMLGTPCYMAPEQIADATSAGPAADQYALGVVLYEALTAVLPFEAGPAMSRPFWPNPPPPPPPPPSARRAGIPPALDEVALRALAFYPHDRFPTVHAMADALRMIDAG
ncbi:MAG: protein kinase [Deltaproteobacteria bacterium]|nr:protein kinase [Deltaproteobacteria bacterium]